MKKRLNVDGQQFYQYQQNEQSPLTTKSLNINKTTPYDVENPDIGLRQVQTCGEAKPISEIPPDNWISSASHLRKTAIFIYSLLMISESVSLTYCLWLTVSSLFCFLLNMTQKSNRSLHYVRYIQKIVEISLPCQNFTRYKLIPSKQLAETWRNISLLSLSFNVSSPYSYNRLLFWPGSCQRCILQISLYICVTSTF